MTADAGLATAVRGDVGEASTGLSQPEFEAQRVDAVQVVAEESLVAHEAQLLVQIQRSPVCDLRLEHNLQRQEVEA